MGPPGLSPRSLDSTTALAPSAGFMTRDVAPTGPNTRVRDAARKMRANDVGALPVSEKDRPVGAVTDRDIVVRAVADERSPGNTSAREVMSERISLF
jgi:CBS domain-containing protein